MQQRWIPALIMIALLVAFRVVGNLTPEALPNFQPFCALFLCGVACQRGALAWVIPVIAWIGSTAMANALNHYPLFTLSGGVIAAFLSFLAIGALALPLRRRATGPILLGGSLAAAVFFHLTTNTAVWLASPSYAKTFHGFYEALWSGQPGGLPTWIFFRNLLAANVLFTALFVLARRSPALKGEGPSLSQPPVNATR